MIAMTTELDKMFLFVTAVYDTAGEGDELNQTEAN